MEELRKMKKILGLTTREMAKELNVSYSLLSKLLIGYRQPSKQFLEKVKKQYPNIDINIFFTS